MTTSITIEEASNNFIESPNQPLLNNQPHVSKRMKTRSQKAVRKAFKRSAHLSNLLPTGSVLVFQMVSPTVTQNGECKSLPRQILTLGFLTLCGASCFLLCFTDSFRDERGKVRYGLATFQGLKVIDGSPCMISPAEVEKYRVKLVDVFHALMSIMVFGAVAMFDKNVSRCFYPTPSEETRINLTVLPVVVGVVCSLLFVLIPSKRHGIGFPLSRH